MVYLFSILTLGKSHCKVPTYLYATLSFLGGNKALVVSCIILSSRWQMGCRRFSDFNCKIIVTYWSRVESISRTLLKSNLLSSKAEVSSMFGSISYLELSSCIERLEEKIILYLTSLFSFVLK